MFGTITQAPIGKGLAHCEIGGNSSPSSSSNSLRKSPPVHAAVKRFFSQGKNILKAKRASLANKTFEMLMFMRGNKHHF